MSAAPRDREATLAAAATADRLGRHGGPIRLNSGTTSVVFAIDDLVLTVAPPGAPPEQLYRRAALARLLEPTGAAVRLVAGADDLQYELDRFVLAWQQVERVSRVLVPAQLGAALRAWHDVELDEVDDKVGALPDRDDLGPLRDDIRLLRDHGQLSRHEEQTLLEVTQRLDDEFRSPGDPETVPDETRRVLLHGDLHRENILVGVSGTVLCDFDEVGTGRRDHDLGFLLDPARPLLDSHASRQAFEDGYGGPLPTVGVARTVARSAHLRRSVAQLLRPDPNPRERFFNRVRLASWHEMRRDWRQDLHPVVAQTFAGHLRRGLRPRWSQPVLPWERPPGRPHRLPTGGRAREVRSGSMDLPRKGEEYEF